MFSIVAINDSDSRRQSQPLAPAKEAQEFHLAQIYQEGLVKLQAKEYDNAQELLESVLDDPLLSASQVDISGSDRHLLQLRFLALKNLASVFLEKGSSHYESALSCYLQAVEIDAEDAVLWNRLGTLSCSMGLLSISRWAFEQGLLCSPNNWNCMEKLLEVLIAIGDEVSCLSVAELILRHWPSHSRALHVKNTIEESEPVPFSPRGIDKLKPAHLRLKFPDKRKTSDENSDEGVAMKKIKHSIELKPVEASWVALTEALLEILRPLSSFSDMGDENSNRSGDVRIVIHLPTSSEFVVRDHVDRKEPILIQNGDTTHLGDCSTEEGKEETSSEGQSKKENLDFASSNDSTKGGVHQYIQSPSLEHSDVAKFVEENSRNCGAYHMAHLLLEYAARKTLPDQDACIKFLELEKLNRNWGQERTPECSIFLAELYYNTGSSPSNCSHQSTFMSEASYHLCKIIESIALSKSFHARVFGDESWCSVERFEGVNETAADESIRESSLLDSFWMRYIWLISRIPVNNLLFSSPAALQDK